MKKCFIPKRGDIFAIRLDAAQYAFGQVVCAAAEGLNIIFDRKDDRLPPLHELIHSPVIFMAYTTYPLIEMKRWGIVGNASVPPGLKFPVYKAAVYADGAGGGPVYEPLHEATESDLSTLKNHKMFSPAVIENAIRARFGLLPWNPYYDELLYKE